MSLWANLATGAYILLAILTVVTAVGILAFITESLRQ